MGARSALCAPLFDMPFPLSSAGGRWPPLREGPICVDCFPEHRRGAQWAPVLPCAFHTIFPRAGNFAFSGRPVAAPTRGPKLCGGVRLQRVTGGVKEGVVELAVILPVKEKEDFLRCGNGALVRDSQYGASDPFW